MSFSFSYAAKGKQRARELAQAQVGPHNMTPQSVADFITAAIDAQPDAGAEEVLFQVSASGHAPQAGQTGFWGGSANITVNCYQITA